MRLIFHWSFRADFAGEVRFQMKGTRFVSRFSGNQLEQVHAILIT
jgi:hypothetical protein